MRTNNQVAIYCTFKEKGRLFYILVKRNEKRGGFWQPVTGGEEDFDNGDLIKTAIREIKEELNITVTKNKIVKLNYSFEFTDKQDVKRFENCFGVILSPQQKKDIRLSEEHTAILYSADTDYLKSLIRFKENQIGLDKLIEYVKNYGNRNT